MRLFSLSRQAQLLVLPRGFAVADVRTPRVEEVNLCPHRTALAARGRSCCARRYLSADLLGRVTSLARRLSVRHLYRKRHRKSTSKREGLLVFFSSGMTVVALCEDGGLELADLRRGGKMHSLRPPPLRDLRLSRRGTDGVSSLRWLPSAQLSLPPRNLTLGRSHKTPFSSANARRKRSCSPPLVSSNLTASFSAHAVLEHQKEDLLQEGKQGNEGEEGKEGKEGKEDRQGGGARTREEVFSPKPSVSGDAVLHSRLRLLSQRQTPAAPRVPSWNEDLQSRQLRDWRDAVLKGSQLQQRRRLEHVASSRGVFLSPKGIRSVLAPALADCDAESDGVVLSWQWGASRPSFSVAAEASEAALLADGLAAGEEASSGRQTKTKNSRAASSKDRQRKGLRVCFRFSAGFSRALPRNPLSRNSPVEGGALCASLASPLRAPAFLRRLGDCSRGAVAGPDKSLNLLIS